MKPIFITWNSKNTDLIVGSLDEQRIVLVVRFMIDNSRKEKLELLQEVIEKALDSTELTSEEGEEEHEPEN